MKHRYIVVFLLLLTVTTFSQEKKVEITPEVTTYYFIRHAEKDRSNPAERNPHLQENGLKRAENWSEIFANIQFNAIYSTDYHRTKETAQPTAEKSNLEIIIYDPSNLNTIIDDFLTDTKGKTVLIVGHSNTIPDFVNVVIGKKKYEHIDDDNNGNLYIVSISDDTIIDQVLTIN